MQLIKHYKEHFQIVPAVTPELKWENYHLRHEVYCQELGFEPEMADEIETDEFDPHSAHCLVRAVNTDTYVGCARLVMTNPATPDAPLPFEPYCTSTLDRSIVDPAKLDRRKIAEISRLAIAGEYRRPRQENGCPMSVVNEVPSPTSENKSRLPQLTLGIYLGLLAMAQHFEIEKVFILSEHRLAKSIARQLGANIVRIGAPVEHRGLCFPFMLDVEHVYHALSPQLRALFDIIADQVTSGLERPYHQSIASRLSIKPNPISESAAFLSKTAENGHPFRAT